MLFKRGTSPVYSAPRTTASGRQQKHRTGHKSHAGDLWGSSAGNLLVRDKNSSESHQLQRPQVDKSRKMVRNQHKKDENTQNQNASPSTGDHSLSSATEQGLMENDGVPLTEVGFRRWMIRNFWELKELVLTQCKETKNFGKRFDEMLARIDNIERNINELTELKNTT